MKELTLGNSLAALIDHRGKTPKKLGVDFTDSGVPVISAKLVADGTIDFASARYVDEATWKRWMPVQLQRNDVILTSEAPLGRTAQIRTNDPVVLGQRLFALRGAEGILDSTFLRYWLDSPRGQASLVSMASGTTVVGIRQELLLKLRLAAPKFKEQQAIGNVLGSLDDKIAANNDVVSASNELIRNLYRALPESSRTLNEVASLAKNNEQPHRFLPDKRLVGLEHFDPKSLWLPRSSEPETATSAKTKFQAGDTLFGKLRPYFHKVAIAPFDGYCSTDILVLRAENPLHSPLVAAAANSDAVVQQAVNSSNGTRMPRAKWTDIEGCPIPDPDAPATLEFIDFAATLIQDATARLEENKALAKTRDELLPLLMSGKITVREASQEAAAAGAQIPSEENEV